MSNQLNTPVAFLIFNRPDTTERVFAEIRRAQPRKLLVVADGPRPDRPGEAEKCAAARAVVERVDWPCDVLTNFSEVNLGCKGRISSGLDWVFEMVEEAIILEDDCLPHPSFFGFCDEMLRRYRRDERVMMVTGTNFLLNQGRSETTYYFSNLVSIWGWATWRTAWKKRVMDRGEFDAGKIRTRYGNRAYSDYLGQMLRGAIRGRIDTWDIQWAYSVMENDSVCVTPLINQVKNIGYAGTHAGGFSSPFFDMPTGDIDLHNINHPLDTAIATNLDDIAIANIVKYNKLGRGVVELLINRLKNELKRISG